MQRIYFLTLLIYVTTVLCNRSKFFQGRELHRPVYLEDSDLQTLSSLSDNQDISDILDVILVPRVVGTANHKKVGDYIIERMSNSGWSVEEDSFTDSTPMFGPLKFRNIIATLNPDAERYLVLACHYDSKYMREGNFVGAIDSAVPCAMMLNLAKTMELLLETVKSNTDVGLMFIFFDGEEAFKQWGPKDSLYGARHLASKWSKTKYTLKSGAEINKNEQIDILILLDLLGTPDPSFYNYFSNTFKWYSIFVQIEQRLSSLNELRRYSNGKPEQYYFKPASSKAYIEDDHIPFLHKNVPVIHLITAPFPNVWHTPKDNRDALDFATIDNLNKILRVFVAKYLHIKPGL